MAGAELAGAELAGAELAGAELAGAELAGAELKGGSEMTGMKSAAKGAPELDSEQYRVVNHRRGHLIVLGAPGTGKSEVLIQSTAERAAEFGPERVLGLTMTRSLARGWQARTGGLLGGLSPLVTTFQSLAGQMISAYESPEMPIRILTAPEQESRVRDLLHGTLQGSVGSGSIPWPAQWREAMGTRSFTRQLRRALARIRGLSLEPGTVADWARKVGDSGWQAIAGFASEYLEVLDWEGALDYQELMIRACEHLESNSDVPKDMAFRAVLVDEAQELDALELRMLRALSARADVTVVAGDPNQTTLAFRGAQGDFFRMGPDESQRVVLRTNYRTNDQVRDVCAALMGQTWPNGLSAGERTALVAPAIRQSDPILTSAAEAPSPEAPASETSAAQMPSAQMPSTRVSAAHFEDAASQAAHLAVALRDAHSAGVSWSRMAVLLKSPAQEGHLITRELTNAAIPVRVEADPLPLSKQPAVALLLQTAVWLAGTPDRELAPTARQAEELLASPLGRANLSDVRALSRWLTQGDLLRDLDPAERLAGALSDLPSDTDIPKSLRQVAERAAELGRVLRRTQELIRSGAEPAAVLWCLWSWDSVRPGAGSWPERLRRAAMGSGAGALSANRDLDAVMKLLRLAERAPARWDGHRGVEVFAAEIEDQEISSEPDLDSAVLRDAVSIGSVFAAKGREWDFVAIPGLLDDRWPGQLRRPGLIDPEQLTADGLTISGTQSSPLEDRRLLYFAMGRAKEWLWLGSHGPDAEPSGFLTEAGLDVQPVLGAPQRAASKWRLVAELRSGCLSEDADVRREAAAGLRRLISTQNPTGRPALRAADPDRWPDAADWTKATGRVRPEDAPVTVSPSALALLSECQRRWFLEREVGGSRRGLNEAAFGTVVHESVAELISRGSLGDSSVRRDVLDRLWAAVQFDSEWFASMERGRAGEALDRAAAWAESRPGDLLPERAVDATLDVELPDEEHDQVRIRGSIDVLEVLDKEQVLIWDFKTSKSKPTKREVADHLQLAAYRMAVEADGVAAADAALLYLSLAANAKEPDLPADMRQGVRSEDLDIRTSQALTAAITCARSGEFLASSGPWCKSCRFAKTCPTKTQGGAS